MIRKLFILLFIGLIGCVPNYVKQGNSEYSNIYSRHLKGNELFIERTDTREVWEKSDGTRIAFLKDRVSHYPNNTDTLYTTEDDCDGQLIAGNTACDCGATTSGTAMGVGCVGAFKCFTDNLTPDYRAYSSFDTGYLNGGSVSSAIYSFYVVSITKSKGWIWDAGLSPLMELVTFSSIGQVLTCSNWLVGTTEDTRAVPSAAGWINWTITDYVNIDRDTDICLRPNTDWNTDADNQGRSYVVDITTNEGGANKPYLTVVYTPIRRTITIR